MRPVSPVINLTDGGTGRLTPTARPLVAAGLLLLLAGCGGAAGETNKPTLTGEVQPVAKEEADRPASSPVHTNWPMFRGNPQLTGVAEEALPDSLSLLWSYKTGSSVEGTAAIVDGVVYVGGMNGIVYAIGLDRGDLKWKYQDSSPPDAGSETKGPVTYGAFKASPCVADGSVFVGDDFGTFYAIDAATGKKRWTFVTTAEIMSSANYVDGKVLFASYDANLYCLSGETGAVVWKFTTETSVHATPGAAGDRVFIAGCDNVLRSVSLEGGKELTHVDLGAPSMASAAVVGDRLYDATFANEIVGIDWQKSERVWTYDPPDQDQPFYASVAVAADRVVAGGRDRHVYCLNRETGEVIWNFPTDGRVDSSPVIAGRRVYFGSYDGNLYGVDLESGKEIWRFTVGERISASPAVADGRLVIGAEDGILYCFGAK